jgi:hypothetical protein
MVVSVSKLSQWFLAMWGQRLIGAEDVDVGSWQGNLATSGYASAFSPSTPSHLSAPSIRWRSFVANCLFASEANTVAKGIIFTKGQNGSAVSRRTRMVACLRIRLSESQLAGHGECGSAFDGN